MARLAIALVAYSVGLGCSSAGEGSGGNPGWPEPDASMTHRPDGASIDVASTNDASPDAPPADAGVAHAEGGVLVCPGTGANCGGDNLQGDPNTLYQCPGKGKAPSSSQVCAQGCQVEPTGTNDYCKRSCSPHGEAALRWEAAEIAAGKDYSDECLGFVNTAYNKVGVNGCPAYCQPSAAAAMNEAKASGRWVDWNGSCPCGAILYWAGNSTNKDDGHVVICNGDGTASTSGWPGFGGSSHAAISWLVKEEDGHSPEGYIPGA